MSNRKFKIAVPATSANIGPGFDCFGMAIDLWAEFLVEEKDGVLIIDEKVFSLEFNDHLVISTIRETLKKLDKEFKGIKISINSQVPISRGLGSSATCIVAGVLIGYELSETSYTVDDIVKMAAIIEGHPDNTTAAVIGGFTISYGINSVDFVKLDLDRFPDMLLFIPEIEVSTRDSREVIPKAFNIEDVVFNIAKSSTLIYSLMSGDYGKIRNSLQDKLHQSSRIDRVYGARDIVNFIDNNQSLGWFLSGSGPTIIGFWENEYDISKVIDKFNGIDNGWKIIRTKLCDSGTILNDKKLTI